jgi:hypothetical protein
LSATIDKGCIRDILISVLAELNKIRRDELARDHTVIGQHPSGGPEPGRFNAADRLQG